jgi:hypothetical protein
MEPLFGLKPEVANTIITAIAMLFSALLGGLIAAWATKRATERALNQSLAIQEDNRRAVLRGVILGIRSELEVLWALYKSEMEAEINKLQSGKGIWITLPIYESYFTVYDSNCSLLGQIADDELRNSIVRAYLAAKSLINAHKHNNELILNYSRPDSDPLAQILASARVNDYGSNIKETYEEASRSAQECLRLIQESELLEVKSRG